MIYIWGIGIGIIIAEILVMLYYELPIWIHMFKHRKDKIEVVVLPNYANTLNEILYRNSIKHIE